ncbi:MAG: exo-alpha-sialidase [Synergistaceae bacterium]|nr:exo-alpha-sialidase [Synergistaceae bacterium]
MPNKTGNMYWRGDWDFCPEFMPGDVVRRNGGFYLALKQNAGLDPIDPLNAAYWQTLGGPLPPVVTEHKDLGGLQGGDAAALEHFHLSAAQWEAAVHASAPGAGNPFLTEADLPYLDKRVTPFDLAAKPDGTETLYAVTWTGTAFVAVGDGKVAVSPDGKAWTAHDAPHGSWRGVAHGAGTLAAVGLGAAAMWSDDGGMTWTPSPAPDGDWSAVAHGNGMFVAVSDGKVMRSFDGRTAWTEKAVPPGHGEDVAFGDGTFVAIGPTGAMTSDDGLTWTEVAGPKATWRCVDWGDGTWAALGGKCMSSTDGGLTWDASDLPSGGWDAVKSGGGFFVAVGNGAQAIVSLTGHLHWAQGPVPNFLWRGLAFGADTFVGVGSGIMLAKVVDVAAALNAARAPSAADPFATLSDVSESAADLEARMNVHIEGRLAQELAPIRDALTWKGA